MWIGVKHFADGSGKLGTLLDGDVVILGVGNNPQLRPILARQPMRMQQPKSGRFNEEAEPIFQFEGVHLYYFKQKSGILDPLSAPNLSFLPLKSKQKLPKNSTIWPARPEPFGMWLSEDNAPRRTDIAGVPGPLDRPPSSSGRHPSGTPPEQIDQHAPRQL